MIWEQDFLRRIASQLKENATLGKAQAWREEAFRPELQVLVLRPSTAAFKPIRVSKLMESSVTVGSFHCFFSSCESCVSVSFFIN